MSQKILYTIFIFLSVTLAYSQTQWEPLNPKPSYFDAKKVKFVSEQTGFIINENQLLQTTNAGATWTVKQALLRPNDMGFKNETGYIACNSGNIYKSVDSGETWILLSTGSYEHYHTISVIDSNTVVVASSNRLLITTNGGTSWSTINFSSDGVLFRNITTVFFTSALTGHIGTGAGSIYKTTDGGTTWRLIESTNIYPSDYEVMYFVNENLGFASKQHSNLMRTTDGGETWNSVDDDQMSMLIYDIHFTNDTTGYACAENNAIYKTTNAGLNWTRLITPDYLYGTAHLYGIYATVNSVYSVGMSGAIYKLDTNDSFSRYSPTYRQINNITFADATTAYALSINSEVYKSTDSGNTWQYIHSFFNTYASARGLEFINASTGYTMLAGGLHKTTDGGQTWNFISILNENIYSMAFTDANTGFISGGYNGSFTKKTTDGGATWQTLNNLRFGKMQFINANVGYARSVGWWLNKLYKTTDGGVTWNEIYSIEEEINDFSFADENTGFIAGAPGVQRKTTDGGMTWEQMPTLPYIYTSIIRFADVNTGFVISDYGEIYKTTNGGENWIYNSTVAAKDVAFSGGNIYISGTGGKILRKASGILSTSNNATTQNHSLIVYPNPANTLFTLSTGIGTIASVKLYDVAGRELIPQLVTLKNNEAIVKLPQCTAGIYVANVVLTDGSKHSKNIIIN